MRNILLFELNEVPFQVIDYYCKKYPNSVLATTLAKSSEYETYSYDEGHLHPWSTWPTVHRGVTNAQHSIKDLGEDTSEVDQKFPPIWKIVKDNNISTGVFMSLHTYPLPNNVEEYKFYVPDPFAEGPECHPSSLNSFQNFSLTMSRKSVRNVDTGIPIKEAAALGIKLPFMGLKTNTIKDVVSQLVDERKSPWKATRRRTYQSV